MKRGEPHLQAGIALIMVMVAVFVLSVLVGAFAYAIKVETRLAQNSNNDEALVWLGRSGVELARYVLAEQLKIPGEPYDSLNQKWAGGPGSLNASNSPIANISLEKYPIGQGTVTVKITDLESKININTATQPILQQVFTSMGMDASETPIVMDSILDWIDADNVTVNGAENDYYQSLDPPRLAKNGPVDDISELLLIRGVTQELFWGAASTKHRAAAFQKRDKFGRAMQQPTDSVGLVNIFTAMSRGKININTASTTVLQSIPGIDENAAEQIKKLRSGPDGIEKTDDDTPFRSPRDGIEAAVGGAAAQIQQYCDVRSYTFELAITAEIGGYSRVFHAVIGRNNQRDLQVLGFYGE